MGRTIDLTKVNLSGKSLFYMTVAMTLVLVLYGVAQVGAVKLREVVKGGAKAVTEQVDDF